MLTPRMSLGIAQTVFYTPAFPLAVYFMIRNGKTRPRMAWWPLIPLTLMRLAGGIVTIVLETKPGDIGLIIAALILLNVGAIPLIVATLGQMRIIMIDNYSQDPRSTKFVKALRLSFLAAVILLVAGGALTSVNQNTSKYLGLAGYVLFAAILAVLIAMEIYLLRRKSELIPCSHKVLTAALCAAPFLIVRTVYGILETANQFATDSPFSPLYGNIYVFAFMCLFQEYIALSIYFWLGFSIAPDRDVRAVGEDDEGYIAKELRR